MAKKFQRWIKQVMVEFDDDPSIAYDVRVTGGAHAKLTLFVGDKSRFIILPTSPSDHRGKLNFRSQVRRTIEALRDAP